MYSCMFNGRYVFYSETFKLQLSSITLHNFRSSLFRSLETCPSRSCSSCPNFFYNQIFNRSCKFQVFQVLHLHVRKATPMTFIVITHWNVVNWFRPQNQFLFWKLGHCVTKHLEIYVSGSQPFLSCDTPNANFIWH